MSKKSKEGADEEVGRKRGDGTLHFLGSREIACQVVALITNELQCKNVFILVKTLAAA